ncbi:hypothetical protein PCE1_000626 [Barthelona sp. PCE]
MNFDSLAGSFDDFFEEDNDFMDNLTKTLETAENDFAVPSVTSHVFLVDMNEKMFEDLGKGSEIIGEDFEFPLQLAFRLIEHTVHNLLYSNPKDEISIFLYNCNDKHQDIVNLIPLKQAGIVDIQLIQEFGREEDKLEEYVGSAFKEYTLSRALQQAVTLFDSFGNRRNRNLWVFTVEEDPCKGKGAAQKKCAQVFNSVLENQTDIQLVFCDEHEEKNLNFWKQIVAGDYGTELPSFFITMEDAMTYLLQKNTTVTVSKRPSAYVPFQAGDLEFFVECWGLVRTVTKPTSTIAVYTDGRTEKSKLKRLMTYMDPETEEPYTAAEIEAVFEVGSRRVIANKALLKRLPVFGERSMRLLGFKPLSQFASQENDRFLGKSVFIRPAEGKKLNSTNQFLSLWSAMIHKGVVGMVTFQRHTSAKLQYGFLVPYQPIEGFDVGEGFLYFPLPFSHQIRELPIPPQLSDEVDTELKNFWIEFLANTTSKYHPANISSPALELSTQKLDSVALNIPFDPNSIIDQTVPQYTRIAQMRIMEREGIDMNEAEVRAQQVLEDFSNAMQGMQPVQRSRTSSRRVAPKEEIGEITDELVQRLVTNGTLKQLKVPQLKEFLAAKGIARSGRKADLMERVEEYFA